MSGFAGIFHSDGRPVDTDSLQRMIAATACDGGACTVWAEGHIGLAHGRYPSPPEPQPSGLVVAEDGLAIVADARLDDRAGLADALGLGNAQLPDAGLILAAYRRWGENCLEHLLGDFAFAIFDGPRNVLFCARDHFGVKPFSYHDSAAGFVFASAPQALFVLPHVTRRINEARIADYLLALMDDAASTLYAGVFRLPPGHCLTLGRGGLRIRAYWRLSPVSGSGRDPVEEFRSLLTEAIRCRLGTRDAVGAMLSGGLDSSSIATIAASALASQSRPPLPTFSLVFDRTPEWNERRFIESVLAAGKFDPVFLESDDYAPFGDFDDVLAEQESAFLAPGLAVSRRLYRAAAAKGLHALLDGHGGDEVVSHGYGRLHELARGNRWFALWREVQGVAGTYGDSRWPIFAAYLDRYGPGRRLRRVRRNVGAALGVARAEMPADQSWSRFVRSDLIARTDVADRFRSVRQAERAAVHDERARHMLLLTSPRVPQSFEVLGRSAAAAGIEPRYPFWDKRLVEFCVGLPSGEKLRDGWSRSILRRSMQDILPAEIQWRRDKLDFAPHVIRGMLARHRALLDGILLNDADGVGAFVHAPEVNAAYRRIIENAEGADGGDVQIVWRTAVLSLWLRRLNRSPSDRAAA